MLSLEELQMEGGEDAGCGIPARIPGTERSGSLVSHPLKPVSLLCPLPAMKTGSQPFSKNSSLRLEIGGQAFSARTLPRPPPYKGGERGGELRNQE